MFRMSVEDIARVTGASVLGTGSRAVCGEVVIDSRAAGEGSLFVAFVGEQVDGNAYLAPAARAGAAAVVATRDVDEAVAAEVAACGCAPRATMARSSCCACPAPGARPTPSGSSWA